MITCTSEEEEDEKSVKEAMDLIPWVLRRDEQQLHGFNRFFHKNNLQKYDKQVLKVNKYIIGNLLVLIEKNGQLLNIQKHSLIC